LTDLLRTPLHALHVALGARMVPFAGYEMPVQYASGILAEHRHTRTHASLFDVSHMGQARLHGSGAAAALESLVPVDVIGLAPGRQRYGFFTNDAGGILDDLMVTNAGDHLYMVVNASCKARDFELLQRMELEILSDRGLLALQGPGAAAVMARLGVEVESMPFLSSVTASIANMQCRISRSGYTGEDGFEISIAAGEAEALARMLLAEENVLPAGLGARDSLRLEAGLCLYGHDIDETTTPVEARLGWAIQKVRRRGGERAGGFPGAATILDQLELGCARMRVGILPEGRAPIREGEPLDDSLGRRVGKLTSGGFGATLDAPLAMGYVDRDRAAPETQLTATVRGKPRACRVCTLPFVPHRYYRGKPK
jgi:aminomethyltransferase